MEHFLNLKSGPIDKYNSYEFFVVENTQNHRIELGSYVKSSRQLLVTSRREFLSFPSSSNSKEMEDHHEKDKVDEVFFKTTYKVPNLDT